MKKDTRVTIQCPSFRRGKKFEGIITGEKPLAALHIAKHGRTYFVKLDGNNKSTQFHESWLAELAAPPTPVKDAGQSDKQEEICNCPFGNPNIAIADNCPIHRKDKQEQTGEGEWRYQIYNNEIFKEIEIKCGDIRTCVIPYFESPAEENAKLIVKAVNNFPAMVEIIKQVNFWFDNESTYPPFTAGYRIAQQAKAILNRINKD
jgi:hypothetical protein